MRKQTISRTVKSSNVKLVTVEINEVGEAKTEEKEIKIAGDLSMNDVHLAVKEQLPIGSMFKIVSVDVTEKTYRMELDKFVEMSEVVEPKTA